MIYEEGSAWLRKRHGNFLVATIPCSQPIAKWQCYATDDDNIHLYRATFKWMLKRDLMFLWLPHRHTLNSYMLILIWHYTVPYLKVVTAKVHVVFRCSFTSPLWRRDCHYYLSLYIYTFIYRQAHKMPKLTDVLFIAQREERVGESLCDVSDIVDGHLTRGVKHNLPWSIHSNTLWLKWFFLLVLFLEHLLWMFTRLRKYC